MASHYWWTQEKHRTSIIDGQEHEQIAFRKAQRPQDQKRLDHLKSHQHWYPLSRLIHWLSCWWSRILQWLQGILLPSHWRLPFRLQNGWIHETHHWHWQQQDPNQTHRKHHQQGHFNKNQMRQKPFDVPSQHRWYQRNQNPSRRTHGKSRQRTPSRFGWRTPQIGHHDWRKKTRTHWCSLSFLRWRQNASRFRISRLLAFWKRNFPVKWQEIHDVDQLRWPFENHFYGDRWKHSVCVWQILKGCENHWSHNQEDCKHRNSFPVWPNHWYDRLLPIEFGYLHERFSPHFVTKTYPKDRIQGDWQNRKNNGLPSKRLNWRTLKGHRQNWHQQLEKTWFHRVQTGWRYDEVRQWACKDGRLSMISQKIYNNKWW